MLLGKETNLEGLATLLAEIGQNSSLDQPSQFRQRVEVLDRLEAYELGSTLPTVGVDESEAAILRQARDLQAKLEAANSRIYAAIRRAIRRGQGASSLRKWLPGAAEREYSIESVRYEGYDFLDDLMIGVLQFEEPETTMIQPTPEMVFYQPTPARHIFDLLDRTALTQNDVLVDIGSGLGHVPILASICTNAHCIGIEIEPAYVRSAQRAAESLQLSRVHFVQHDARSADFNSGTAFYLYTPFTGTILRTALDRLREQARSRPIRVCTFGPCTPIVGAEDWLEAIGPLRPDRIAIMQARLSR
jgi:Methyltransferase domain